MASTRAVPNSAFRRLRGHRSPGEFAAAVRRAAREIGEQVACDARYVGRVEAGEIRCPNYAYERVFLHMFPGLTLTDLGFSDRESVRGRASRTSAGAHPVPCPVSPAPAPVPEQRRTPPTPPAPAPAGGDTGHGGEESDVRRRAFMTSGTASVAAVSLSLGIGVGLGAVPATAAVPGPRRVGAAEVDALEETVRRIRLLDDRHGADGLYRRAAQPLRTAYALLDAGTRSRRATAGRLHASAGELAISVGWLAHDSGRFDDARSHYAEALATARIADDPGVEAHAFSNMSFLARDAGRYREAVRAAQAGLRAARDLGSPRLLSLLALREAGGWAGLGDRTACERSLGQAHALFGRGTSDTDPEWMSFFGEPERESLEARCRAALGDWPAAARHAYRATVLLDPHFARNLALYRAELATDLAQAGFPDEAASAGHQVLDLMGEVQSTRIQGMLAGMARTLLPRRRAAEVSGFLDRHASTAATAHRTGPSRV
ncbi:tetratricopeptide repeat protein [Streptomyces sp. NBC_01498]|uniref:tetratricopeptide repeat protein n=1 Tax=Streptomyces sp. NBC_01498 TaxID=2975870 RepID=UPI002E7C0A2E|nr:tetratricopeptide repeat protein [Streptomyces sp. NBC_01498]WTL26771.1 tetratricopeptide repeat protein [Streptomyces sp. NBC_01498]